MHAAVFPQNAFCMKKRTSWKDHFYFTRSERYGSWLLGLLLVLSFLLPRSGWLNPAPEVDLQRLDEAVAVWQALQLEKAASSQGGDSKRVTYAQKSSRSAKEPASQLRRGFPFDPNTVSSEELAELGFSPSLARTFLHFRESGARFRRPEDLLKVYGMKENFFRELQPYIRFAGGERTSPSEQDERVGQPVVADFAEATKTNYRKAAPVPIDINAATRQAWENLPGIGPYYASRILRFRDALGGFYEVEQVGDTRNLPDSVFQKIFPFLRLATPPQKLNLTTATAEELAAHPYISRKQAEVLVKYREWHGAFHAADELLKTGVFDAQEVERLKPYLQLEIL